MALWCACAPRWQIDEHDDNPGEEAAYLKWGEDVIRALENLPSAQAPPVCEWTQPAAKIATFDAGDDEAEVHPLGIPTVYVVGMLPFVAYFVYYWRYAQAVATADQV